MLGLLMQYIDHQIDLFDLQAVRDILLEFLAGIAFVFLLIIVIIAMIKAPMLIGHGSIEMSIFVFLGLVHSAMNLADEFIYFTQDFYPIWKGIKDFSLLTGAIILMIGFFRFFIFSARLFGTDIETDEDVDIDYIKEDDDVLDEAVEEVEETIEEADIGFTDEEIIDEVVEEVVEETLEDVLEQTVDDTYEEAIEDLSEELAEEVTQEEPEVIEEITEEFIDETSIEEATPEEDVSLAAKIDYTEAETPEVPTSTEEILTTETIEPDRIPETLDEEAEDKANEEAFEELYTEEIRDEEASEDK